MRVTNPPGVTSIKIDDVTFKVKVGWQARYNFLALVEGVKKERLSELKKRLDSGEYIDEQQAQEEIGVKPSALLDTLIHSDVVRGWNEGAFTYIDESEPDEDKREKPLPFSKENFADCVPPDVQAALAWQVMERALGTSEEAQGN